MPIACDEIGAAVIRQMYPGADPQTLDEIGAAMRQQLFEDAARGHQIADAVLGDFLQQPIDVLTESEDLVGSVFIDLAQRTGPLRTRAFQNRFLLQKVFGVHQRRNLDAIFVERQVVEEELRKAADRIVVSILRANEHLQRRAGRPRRLISLGDSLVAKQ